MREYIWRLRKAMNRRTLPTVLKRESLRSLENDLLKELALISMTSRKSSMVEHLNEALLKTISINGLSIDDHSRLTKNFCTNRDCVWSYESFSLLEQLVSEKRTTLTGAGDFEAPTKDEMKVDQE